MGKTDLSAVAAELAAEWQLELGDLLTGGSFAYVLTALEADGRECVLKINPPDVETAGTYASERDVLTAAAGRGYAALYRCDDARRALLLERLGPTMADEDLPLDDRLTRLARVLMTTWSLSLPRVSSLISAAEKCEWLVDFLDRGWRENGEPCSRVVIDEAIRHARSRGRSYDASTAIVLHGDAHPWNALRAGPESYKLIDPDPFVGEREAELGVPIREWNAELLATGDSLRAVQERVTLLCTLTSTDPVAVWEWGYVERVATALVCVIDGEVEWARDAFVVAESCVGGGPA